MIWATVSSQSCFGWLYRASQSLDAKNIINLISVLTIWWCPCVESCVVGRGCLLWPVHSLGKSLLVFACIPRPNLPVTQCFLTSYFCIPVAYNEKDIGPCFHHQSHPQLGHVFALSPSVHSFWSYFSTDLQ